MAASGITIVITSDHQASRLEETLRSVLEQEFAPLELIVIDAGGDEVACDLLRAHEAKLAWSVSQETWNPARVLNAAFSRAKGEIVGHVPAGTRLTPGALQHLADEYARHKSPWMVGWSRLIEPGAGEWPCAVKPHNRPMDWFLANPIPDAASFLTTALWRRAGRFRESLKQSFKYEYWMRLRFSEDVGPHILHQCLAATSLDEASLHPDIAMMQARELKRIRREYRRHLPMPARLSIANRTRLLQAQTLRAEAQEASAAHRTRKARRLAMASLTRDPLSLAAWRMAATMGRGETEDRVESSDAMSGEPDQVSQERQMRVTVVCSMFPPALAPEAAHASLLCRHLAEAGCDVTLITSRIEGIREEGLPYTLRATMNGWGWNDAPRLVRELARSKPDVVLLIYLGWIYDRQPMVTFLPTLCRRLKKRPRVITQFENSQGSDLKLPKQWRAWKAAALLAGRNGIEHRFGTLLRDSDEVIALCEPHLDDLTRHFAPLRLKTTVIPAPPLLKMVDDPSGEIRRATRARLGYRDGDFVVAYFGYIYPEKGVETVIEAAGLALAAVPDIRLLMIGGVPGNLAARDPHYPQRVRDLTHAKGLSTRTYWTGHCEPEGDEASSYLHAADAVVLPFLQGVRLNNSSYSVVTCHGLPVITTRGVNLEPEFRDRDNVMLFNPGDAKAAGQAIVDVATNPALRAALSAGAIAYSHGRASWPAVTRQTIEVLREARPLRSARPAAQSLRPAMPGATAAPGDMTPAL